ncbi:MAG: PD40 domain-containing protein [Deltaproteobacteria bacterium]|nr:PD40 domain-containing protein [Deltaproteobacteria bacterium]
MINRIFQNSLVIIVCAGLTSACMLQDLQGIDAMAAEVAADLMEQGEGIPADTPSVESTQSVEPHSRECQIIYTSDRDGDAEIFVIYADGLGEQQLTFNENMDSTARWSPDGTKIGFTSDRDGDREVFVMDADGSNIEQLTSNEDQDYFGDWSPDGTKIAFSSDRDGDQEIFIMNADGSEPKQLTNDAYTTSFRGWSPDGKQIAIYLQTFSTDLGHWTFETFGLDSQAGDTKQLVPEDELEWYPPRSKSSGRTLLVQWDAEGDYEIYTIDEEGENQHQLTDNDSNDISAKWSPDGTRIAFVSDRDGDYDIFIMDADGSNVQQLTFKGGDDYYSSWLPQCQ